MITNEFSSFYSSLGESLAAKITNELHDVNYYLSKIPRNISSLVLRSTNINEIEKLIESLPNKSSHGHDKISNVLLKELNTSISFPLNMIFNQLIEEGKFLTLMKRTEIILLYKGKNRAK